MYRTSLASVRLVSHACRCCSRSENSTTNENVGKNRRSIEQTETRLAAIEAQKLELLRKEAVEALDPQALADDSEAGYHWQVLQPSVDINDYYHYLSRFDDSPYREECPSSAHRNSHVGVHGVNHKDPIDISYFLMSRPYFALARHARDQMAKAIEGAPKAHESEFWEKVGQPPVGVFSISLSRFIRVADGTALDI